MSHKSQVCFKDFPSGSFIQGPPLAPRPRSYRQVFPVPEGPLSFWIYDPGPIPPKHASTHAFRSLMDTRLLFTLCRNRPALCCHRVATQAYCTRFVPTHQEPPWRLDGTGREHGTGVMEADQILSRAATRTLHALFTHFPTKASKRRGAIKSHGKEVVHFIYFF